jgi:hypothetical protein
MKINRYIAKTSFRSSGGTFLTDHCSGAFLDEFKRSALLTGMLGVIVVLATGCSSTGAGLSARLIAPTVTNRPSVSPEDNGSYQPPRSPAFSDLLGG